MRLVDLTTKPWQLMLPGENEASLNKMVYLPGTLDEFGVVMKTGSITHVIRMRQLRRVLMMM